MTAPTSEQSPLTQASLDALIEQRLDWASRFASALAHDLGNVSLIASMMAPDDNKAQANSHETSSDLAKLALQIRGVLNAVSIWRRGGPQREHPCTPKQWWNEHGRMIRQFVSPSVRVKFNDARDDLTIDSGALCMSLAAIFVAIDSQIQPLEHIIVRIKPDDSAPRALIEIEVSPVSSSPAQFVSPSCMSDLDGLRVSAATEESGHIVRFQLPRLDDAHNESAASDDSAAAAS